MVCGGRDMAAGVRAALTEILAPAGLTPALLKAIREGDEAAVDEYSVPQRAAMLALSRDFGR